MRSLEEVPTPLTPYALISKLLFFIFWHSEFHFKVSFQTIAKFQVTDINIFLKRYLDTKAET